MKKLLGIFLVLVSMINLVGQAVAATIPKGLTLESDTHGEMAIIKIEVSPGKEYTFNFTVRNNHGREAQYQLYPSDVVTKVGGGWMYRRQPTDNVLAGSWYQEIPRTTFSIIANGVNKHSLTIKVPDSIQPGEYISGVVLSESITADELAKRDPENAELAAGAKEIGIERPIHIVMNYKAEQAKSQVRSLGAVAYIDDETANRPFSDYTGLFLIDLEFGNQGGLRGKVDGVYIIKEKSSGKTVVESQYVMEDIYSKTTGIYRILPNGGYLKTGVYIIEWTANGQKYSHEFEVTNSQANAALLSADNSNKITIHTNNNALLIYTLVGIVVLLVVVIIVILLRRNRNAQTPAQNKNPYASA